MNARPSIRTWTHRLVLGFCALLAVAVAVFWTRSFMVGERYRWAGDTGGTHPTYYGGVLASGKGGFAFFLQRLSTKSDRSVPDARAAFERISRRTGYVSTDDPRYPVRINATDVLSDSLGFGFTYNDAENVNARDFQFGVTSPYWAPFVVALLYPLGAYTFGVIRRQREERLALGLCPHCGTLLPTGDVDRCSACGKALPAPPPTHDRTAAAPSA